MRAIIIGAGRGRRLMPTTADTPKCFAEVQGRRLLDWTLKAFRRKRHRRHLFHRRLPDRARARRLSALHLPRERRLGEQQYPALAHACRGSDGRAVHVHLFGHALQRRRGEAPARESGRHCAFGGYAIGSPATSTAPSIRPTDAEKVTVANGLVTRIHRGIDPSLAHGEYTGDREIHSARCRGAEGALSPLPAGLCRQAVPRSVGVRKGLSHPSVSGHDRGRGEDGACRHPRQLHRGGHAAGFRIRAKLLAWLVPRFRSS